MAKEISIKWTTTDIHNYAMDEMYIRLKEAQEEAILDLLEKYHSPDIGINWDTIGNAVLRYCESLQDKIPAKTLEGRNVSRIYIAYFFRDKAYALLSDTQEEIFTDGEWFSVHRINEGCPHFIHGPYAEYFYLQPWSEEAQEFISFTLFDTIFSRKPETTD